MNVSPLEPGVPNAVRFYYNGFHQTGDIRGKFEDGSYKVTRYLKDTKYYVVYSVKWNGTKWIGRRVGTEPANI